MSDPTKTAPADTVTPPAADSVETLQDDASLAAALTAILGDDATRAKAAREAIIEGLLEGLRS